MPLRVDGDTVHFASQCTAEEALPLVDFFLAAASPKVVFEADASLHCALLQVLAACPHELIAPPSDPLVAQFLLQLRTPESHAPVPPAF
jgi:hypothetical protein